MQLTEDAILSELKENGSLPSPTGVALTILDLTRDPNTQTDDMAMALQADPALTGQILKYANSPNFVGREPAKSINEALVRLGMTIIRQLCLGFSVLSNARLGPCHAFDYKTYWTRSLAIGVSCQILCRNIKSVSPDEGFTCGLLSGIGQLALASVYPDKYEDILHELEDYDSQGFDSSQFARLLELETNTLNIDSSAVTGLLFEDWGLPDSYAEAVKNHHRNDWDLSAAGLKNETRGLKLARIMSVALEAADICIETGPKRHKMVLDFMELAQDYNISEIEWMEMYDEILAEWARMGSILDVNTHNVPPMDKLFHQAQNFSDEIPPKKTKTPSEPTAKTSEIDGSPLVETSDLEISSQPKTGMEILLATDSPVDMRILDKKLTEAGHTVYKVVNGREALTAALQHKPQLILTDWKMPEMDGLELCRTLRQSKQVGNIYTIIMTAQAGNDQLVEAFEAGIDDYLVKPLNQRVTNARLHAAKRLIDLQEEAAQSRAKIRTAMSELGIANRKLTHLALKDSLTALPNRRAGLDQLAKEWARSSRANDSMLVMIMDIDFFKAVNDKYGHDAGDVVLKKTASVMQDTMRNTDTVCRYGGEEFLVICPSADVEVAKEMGDRLRLAVQNNIIDSPEFQGNITVSIGVCVRSAEHTSYSEMIKCADEALYAAKDAGRNLVCIS